MEVRVLKMKKNTCFLNHFNLCKKSGDDTTNIETSTPTCMVYGELGRYPLDIDIKVRTISFWAKLISGKQTICYHS